MIRWIGVGLIGLAGGFASGLFGVGGGILFVPLLVLLLKWDLHLAIGTSLAAIVPTAIVGAFRHFSEGEINFRIALFLALFAILGAWLGAGLSLKTDVVLLRKVFSIFLIALALKLFFKS